MNSSREKILNRLKEAQNNRGEKIISRPDFNSPIYPSSDKNLIDSFQSNIELVGGKVFRVKNLKSAVSELKQILKAENQDYLICLEPLFQQALEGQISFKSSLNDLNQIHVGLTSCELLVAHLGSILVSSASFSGRRLHVFPEIHIVLAHQNQLINYLDEALEQLDKKYQDRFPTMVTNITGPSRTADIEKTLVMGMHGPKKLFVLLAEESF